MNYVGSPIYYLPLFMFKTTLLFDANLISSLTNVMHLTNILETDIKHTGACFIHPCPTHLTASELETIIWSRRGQQRQQRQLP